jgi:STE24 endopeptidase
LVILTGIVSGLLFGPLGNALSRHFEKQADLYALENIKEKKAFMTALAGLADRNLSNAYPEWWVKILYYSHPPIGKRLRTEELFGSGPSDIPQ